MERRSLKIFSSKSRKTFFDEIRTIFKKNHLTYFILNLAFPLLTQCTHIPREDNRKPALQEALSNQESDQKSFERAFQLILQSKNFNQLQIRLQTRLELIEELYFRAYLETQKFDEKLNGSFERTDRSIDDFYAEVLSSKVYPRLLVIIDQLNHRRDEFAYFIERFLEISSASKNLDYSRQELIITQEVLNYLGSYYRQIPLQDLIAHTWIIDHLKIHTLTDFNLIAGINRILYGNEGKWPKTEQEMTFKHLNTPELKRKIREAAHSMQTKKTFLSMDLEQKLEVRDANNDLNSQAVWGILFGNNLENFHLSFSKIDSIDWQNHDVNGIVDRVRKQVSLSKKDNGLILFHGKKAQTLKILEQLMKHLNQGTTRAKVISAQELNALLEQR